MNEDLNFHLYTLDTGQQLKPWDNTQGLNFACQMETNFETNDNLILLRGDEFHFHLNSMMNSMMNQQNLLKEFFKI